MYLQRGAECKAQDGKFLLETVFLGELSEAATKGEVNDTQRDKECRAHK